MESKQSFIYPTASNIKIDMKMAKRYLEQNPMQSIAKVLKNDRNSMIYPKQS